MQKNNIILVLGILLIGLVSANGISISTSSIVINKTNGVDYSFKINITNQETFKFYNITSQNSIISIPKFSLESGETKQVTATISSDSDFSGDINIIGDYFADLGDSDDTYNIEISTDGVDICNLDLIQGDTIIWDNKLSGEVKLKNMNTNEYFQTIEGGSQYTSLFESPQEFDYAVYKTGLMFSNLCHINVRPEIGYVHSSEYDATLNLDLNIDYEPTTVTTSFFSDSYSLDYNSEKEDTFRITNTGSEVAKNIRLSGDWFTFSDNNFDIAVGDYKTITYTISPLIYQTNQTGKHYNKSIIIEGNFNTLEKVMDIFVNYKDISGIYGDGSYDIEVLEDMVNFFCSVYPDKCPTTVIYGNESDRNITMILNEEAYREKILSDDRNFELLFSGFNNLTEIIIQMRENDKIILSNTNITAKEAEEQANATKGVLSVALLGMTLLMLFLIVGIVTYTKLRKGNSIKAMKILGKGELP